MLGISAKTLRRWEDEGIIRCFRTLGNHRRIHISEIKRILAGTDIKKPEYVIKRR